MSDVGYRDWLIEQLASLQVNEAMEMCFMNAEKEYIVHQIAPGQYVIEDWYPRSLETHVGPVKTFDQIVRWTRKFEYDVVTELLINPSDLGTRQRLGPQGPYTVPPFNTYPQGPLESQHTNQTHSINMASVRNGRANAISNETEFIGADFLPLNGRPTNYKNYIYLESELKNGKALRAYHKDGLQALKADAPNPFTRRALSRANFRKIGR